MIDRKHGQGFNLPHLNEEFTALNKTVARNDRKRHLLEVLKEKDSFTSLAEIKIMLSDVPALAGMTGIVALNLLLHPEKIPEAVKKFKKEPVSWEE